jgi:hypothetical protein
MPQSKRDKAIHANIREYKKQKDRSSGATSGWHRNINVTGTIAERLRNGNDNRAFAQEKHFTRCELKYPLKDCQEDRGHLYAVSLTHPSDFHNMESSYSRKKHECVFCGDEWDQRGNKLPENNGSDGKIVKDVVNNQLVRDEAKLRNISLRHYKMDQESEDKDKFKRERDAYVARQNAEYAWKNRPR